MESDIIIYGANGNVQKHIINGQNQSNETIVMSIMHHFQKVESIKPIIHVVIHIDVNDLYDSEMDSFRNVVQKVLVSAWNIPVYVAFWDDFVDENNLNKYYQSLRICERLGIYDIIHLNKWIHEKENWSLANRIRNRQKISTSKEDANFHCYFTSKFLQKRKFLSSFLQNIWKVASVPPQIIFTENTNDYIHTCGWIILDGNENKELESMLNRSDIHWKGIILFHIPIPEPYILEVCERFDLQIIHCNGEMEMIYFFFRLERTIMMKDNI